MLRVHMYLTLERRDATSTRGFRCHVCVARRLGGVVLSTLPSRERQRERKTLLRPKKHNKNIVSSSHTIVIWKPCNENCKKLSRRPKAELSKSLHLLYNQYIRQIQPRHTTIRLLVRALESRSSKPRQGYRAKIDWRHWTRCWDDGRSARWVGHDCFRASPPSSADDLRYYSHHHAQFPLLQGRWTLSRVTIPVLCCSGWPWPLHRRRLENTQTSIFSCDTRSSAW